MKQRANIKELYAKFGQPMLDKPWRGHKSLKPTMKIDVAKKCFAMQRILRGISNDTIELMFSKGKLKKHKKGDVIASQNEDGEIVFFILKGSINVFINGRKIAVREAKECVGEMTVLDPTAKRSATLIAAEEVHLLEVESSVFDGWLSENNTILRNESMELCSRLNERSIHYNYPNKKEKIFIGSSSESIEKAKTIEKALDGFDIKFWGKNVFAPSENNIDALLLSAQDCDFAVIVMTPDDFRCSRKKFGKVPRDNVVFELGLFMGAIGKERTYIVTEPDAIMPSDLDGVTKLYYISPGNGEDTMGEVINKIKETIKEKGVK